MASPKTRRTAKKSQPLKPHSQTGARTAKQVAVKKATVKKVTVRKTAKKSASARPKVAKRARAKPPARRKATGFGRVRVPVDARLDLVFQKDYQAREIFDFLKVQSIRELEQFAADEIIERLTGPMVQTVQRIRKTLALVNRHLLHDEKFAKAFLKEVSPASAKPRGSQK
jgi:hypothetical protein